MTDLVWKSRPKTPDQPSLILSLYNVPVRHRLTAWWWGGEWITAWAFCSFLVLGTGNLFATKWVHIKHYGLKIGVPNFWWDSASFLNSKNTEITKMGSTIPGTCYSEKKKAPARKPANSRPEWGSTPRWSIHQNPIQVLVKKWLFPKVKKKFQRIAQIEAVA